MTDDLFSGKNVAKGVAGAGAFGVTLLATENPAAAAKAAEMASNVIDMVPEGWLKSAAAESARQIAAENAEKQSVGQALGRRSGNPFHVANIATPTAHFNKYSHSNAPHGPNWLVAPLAHSSVPVVGVEYFNVPRVRQAKKIDFSQFL